MRESSEVYDLILVVGYFRSATPLLSVLRYLGPKCRIGVCFQPLNLKTEAKTGSAQRAFEKLCQAAGAEKLDLKAGVGVSKIECSLMVVQQYPYSSSFISDVKLKITSRNTWAMLSLASMGLGPYDEFLSHFDFGHLLVPDFQLASFLIERRGATSRYDHRQVTEVGLPFLKYPVFSDFSVDWIIAAPTLFSFHTESEKQKFLCNVIKLLRSIPDGDVVFYKSHNGNVRDYLTPALYSQLGKILHKVPKINGLLRYLLDKSPKMLRKYLDRIITASLYEKMIRRATPMKLVTPYADMSIEAFLPSVRKGVIGGNSNTIWGALFAGVPYFNCTPNEERLNQRSNLLNKTGEALLGLNLEYFGVPCCDGDINKGSVNEKIKFDSKRHKNIVDLVLSALDCSSK